MAGFLGFVPTFFRAEKSFSPALAGLIFASVFLIAILVGPFAGRLGDSISRIYVGVVATAVAICRLIVLVIAGSAAGVIVAVVVVAAGVRAFPPVMQAYPIGLFPSDNMAGDLGAMKTIWTGVGSFAPTYVGIVATRASYTVAFTGFIGTLTVACLILLFIHRGGE